MARKSQRTIQVYRYAVSESQQVLDTKWGTKTKNKWGFRSHHETKVKHRRAKPTKKGRKRDPQWWARLVKLVKNVQGGAKGEGGGKRNKGTAVRKTHHNLIQNGPQEEVYITQAKQGRVTKNLDAKTNSKQNGLQFSRKRPDPKHIN